MKKMETAVVWWGYIGIVEKRMETAIGFRVWALRLQVLDSVWD